MSYPRAHPGVLRRNIFLTLSISIAIAVISGTLWLQASEIGLEHSSILLQGGEVVLFSLLYLFIAVLLGSIAEYLDAEANLLVIGFAFVFPLLLAWRLGMFNHEELTYAILAGMGCMVLYLFLSSPRSQRKS